MLPKGIFHAERSEVLHDGAKRSRTEGGSGGPPGKKIDLRAKRCKSRYAKDIYAYFTVS